MNQTRSNKFEKRRKNTNAITILSIAAGVVLVVFLAIWVFGENDTADEGTESDASENTSEGNNGEEGGGEDDNGFLITDPDSNDEDNNDNEDANKDEENEDEGKEEDASKEEEDNEDEEDEDNSYEDRESAEPSDNNVSEAYTGDWDPVGTEQEGEHNTDFGDGSQDRAEIKKATSLVTGLSEDGMIEHWVGNNGPDKVIATVSDSSSSEFYRVFLDWVDGEGWQPTKVEKLIENDAGQ
ncbi:YrrS family protein [Oceanobacillus sojae]|uniref:YrrS family protein n=1 Tax=Oceanobacillus sojae TaxID=582851 RepID=UPI0021A3D3C6|nr:YrrS family protein [Oceanobacillus sojae]MCT1903318.1 YrrS family protein [Oceanobacillus sojae]